MTKELRKSLRLWLEGMTKAQTELESLNTKENQEIMAKYPVQDFDWRHPTSHIFERTVYFTEQARKCVQKMIGALPAERKTKIVKFIEPKPSKEKSLSEQAKSTKEKKKQGARSSVSDPGTKKRGRKPKNASGIDGSNSKSSGNGVQSEVQHTRKRGRPPKQK